MITWPENAVEVLERGKDTSLCRAKKTGAVLEILNTYLYEHKGETRCNQTTDILLPVEKGEMVSLLQAFDDRLFIAKNGEAGFLLLPNLE